MNLGKLREYYTRIGDTCEGEHKRVLKEIIKRMADIDSDITKSLYGAGDPTGADDRPPDGDDYNALWDALIDEIDASMRRG